MLSLVRTCPYLLNYRSWFPSLFGRLLPSSPSCPLMLLSSLPARSGYLLRWEFESWSNLSFFIVLYFYIFVSIIYNKHLLRRFSFRSRYKSKIFLFNLYIFYVNSILRTAFQPKFYLSPFQISAFLLSDFQSHLFTHKFVNYRLIKDMMTMNFSC